MKSSLKRAIIFAAILVGLANVLANTLDVGVAYADENKATTININEYGEQYIDIICIIGFWIISLAGLILFLGDKK